MAEDNSSEQASSLEESSLEEDSEEKKSAPQKKKSGWFEKIPRDVLLSPPGLCLMAFAVVMEAIDMIVPWPLVEELIMLPLNISFCIALILVAKVSVKSLVIPFLIERIPIISSMLPTFLLRLLL